MLPKVSRINRIKSIFGICVFLLFFSFAGSLVQLKNSLNKSDYFFSTENSNYTLRINSEPIEKPNSLELRVDVLSRNKLTTSGVALVYIKKDKKSLLLRYGDVLLCNTKFSKIKINGNPNEFKYNMFLRMFDIHHSSFVKSSSWIKIRNSSNILFRNTYLLSNYFSQLIDDAKMKSKNKAILKALLIGDKEGLSKDILRTYSSAGAMHVLAVSGLHVGIIMMVLSFILKPIKQINFGKQTYVFLILFGVWFYAFITGLSPSVVRSSLMFSFVIIGRELERDTNVYQSILVSAFVLMLLNPLVIFKVGFQLSYLAVVGIIYLQPKIYNLFYLKNKLLDYSWKISSVSIAAQIATFPLGLFYFHQFPNFFFISNLIVIPLAFSIILSGIIFLLANKIPYLNSFTELLLDWQLSLLNYCVTLIESIPGSISWGISISWVDTFMIYGCLLLGSFAFSLKKVRLLFLSILMLCVLFGVRINRNVQIKNSNELIVYNIKNELAIDVFYGSNNIFICSDELKNNKSAILFNIEHYWYYRKGSERPSRILNINKLECKIFKLDNKTFSILNLENSEIKYLTDYVILSENIHFSGDELNQLLLNGSTLIIHPKCNYKLVNYITKNYDSNLIYNINKKGAFIFSF